MKVPDDKHMYLKVIGFGLSMLDNKGKADPVSIYTLEKKKKLNLAKIDRMFKELQVVTLFGDMQITLSSYIEKMSDFAQHRKGLKIFVNFLNKPCIAFIWLIYRSQKPNIKSRLFFMISKN